MKPYLFLKRNQNHYNIDCSELVDVIDLYDISKYFISLDTDTWVPSCYWSKIKPISILEEPRFLSEIMWGVFSYLIGNKFLVIEDRYYGSNSNRDEFIKRDSYYSPLEKNLYKLIIDRLVNEGYLLITGNSFLGGNYQISKTYHRLKNLDYLI